MTVNDNEAWKETSWTKNGGDGNNKTVIDQRVGQEWREGVLLEREVLKEVDDDRTTAGGTERDELGYRYQNEK